MTHYTDTEALIVEPIPLVKDEAARHLLARKLEFTLSETERPGILESSGRNRALRQQTLLKSAI